MLLIDLVVLYHDPRLEINPHTKRINNIGKLIDPEIVMAVIVKRALSFIFRVIHDITSQYGIMSQLITPHLRICLSSICTQVIFAIERGCSEEF